MEQVRMPPAQPQAAPKASAASAPEEAASSGETAPAAKAGFARLLAALDGATALPSAIPETAGVPALPQSDLSCGPADSLPRPDLSPGSADSLPQLGLSPGHADSQEPSVGAAAVALEASATDNKDGLGTLRDKPGVPSAAGDTKPAVDPTQVLAGNSLQEHLSMLLNQGRHALAGQAFGPGLMIHETARIDAATPPALGARKGAAGAAGRVLGLTTGALQQALVAASVAGSDGAAAGAVLAQGAEVDASLSAPTKASGQELLKSVLERVRGGEDARVSLQGSGAQGALATMGQASPLHGSAAGDAALAPWSSRVASAGDAQAQGGAASGGGAGLQPPPLQPGLGAADASAGPGADGSAPGSFMEQLGEQVAFWVHQKSQRAEFTLDRDGQPVQVQLSLTGDVAKITFLSDHAAARQALDAGIEDLRASLQQQGLALADVNVGVAGGQGDGGSGADQGRGGPARGAGARGTAQVLASEPVQGAHSRGRSDRALDIFV